MNTIIDLKSRIVELENLITEKKTRLSDIAEQIERHENDVSVINNTCCIKWTKRHKNEFGTWISGSYQVVNVAL